MGGKPLPIGKKSKLAKGAWCWASYDIANSAFALVILTAIFPIFFGSYWASELEPSQSTARLSIFASLSSILVALSAPFLGAWTDAKRKRKLLVFGGTVVGAAATMSMALPGSGQWELAGILYLLGVAGFSLANVGYDALLPAVSNAQTGHRTSALGFALGYFGSTILLVAALVVIQGYEGYGFSSKADATKLFFVLTGVWWLVWTIPLMVGVKEQPLAETSAGSLRLLIQTARNALSHRSVWVFLLAYFFYIDGVGTIIRTASKIASDIGTPQDELMVAIIVVQLVGVPCALLFGWVAQRIGPKAPLALAVFVYAGISIAAGTISPRPIHLGFGEVGPVMLLAIMIGMVQGGVQSLSRSFFAQIIPAEEAGAYFGLYNVIGKGSAILGPLSLALVASASGSSQRGIIGLTPFFIIGALLLLSVKVRRTTSADTLA